MLPAPEVSSPGIGIPKTFSEFPKLQK